jgi:hypothetical protein
VAPPRVQTQAVGRSEVLAQMLVQLGWASPLADAPIRPGPYVPKMPDRLVIVTATPGPGYMMDGAVDQIGFQCRTRGRPSADDRESYPDAENLAFELDSLIYSANALAFPLVVMGTVIVSVWRAGGQPAPMSPDPDDADRYVFTANYVAIVGV